ncbi:hypothetical protein PZA11_001745 [Diplocarpon coronariae]|uniref:Uncharacterized protein n=1 Tax=Diplocarpon coronariae TaxID=2795749 RepID=A0A218YZG8_9HELO|nr:hypothetical protein B2J93_5449 [Marssonina coronariae]
MEEVELQIRANGLHQAPYPHVSNPYPHSLDRRLLAGDAFRDAKIRLENTLRSIEDHYSSPAAGFHTGSPHCPRCLDKKKHVSRAYYDYYLSDDARSWYAEIPQYKHEIQRRFDNPDAYSLDDIHVFFQATLREHLKQDLCAARRGDNGAVTSFKYKTSDLFNESIRSTSEILTAYLDNISLICPNKDSVGFVHALQNTTTPEERAQIYIQYYCASSWDDPPAVKTFKAKWARMFESLAPHDEILAAMRREADGCHASKLSELQGKLSDIKMAQSAHLKNKKRKAEKDQRDQRVLDREPSPRTERCTLGGCPAEINLLDGTVIECAICEWLDRKGGDRGRAVYCSVEHAEADFDEHDLHDHGCMADRCIYSSGGPGPSDTPPGICQCCSEQDTLTFFCSLACYQENFADHRERVFHQRGPHNHYQMLDYFRPEEHMEIIS